MGGAALSALPLITAGFFSKDEILAGAMANGHINLMVAGLVGAFMTSLYTFRMIFIVFHGKEQIHAHAGKGITHHLPLIVLLVLSTFVGALIVPPLEGVLPQTTELAHGSVMTLEIASGIIAIAGILIAAWLWLGKRTLVTSIANSALAASSVLVVPCTGLRLVIRQGVRKTIPRYCLAAETRSAELVDEYPGDPFPLRRQRPAGERERLSALVCGFNEHRRGGGAGAADGIALI